MLDDGPSVKGLIRVPSPEFIKKLKHKLLGPSSIVGVVIKNREVSLTFNYFSNSVCSSYWME